MFTGRKEPQETWIQSFDITGSSKSLSVFSLDHTMPTMLLFQMRKPI